MASESSAFCPGHVTAFFAPVEDPDPYQKGSRGGGPAPAPGWAVERAIGGAAFEVVVQSEVQLPVSQGFGMSAAGALSATLAGEDAVDLALSHSRCVAVAHAAEVVS